MSFRLPSHMDSLYPPPVGNSGAASPLSRPWRGTFIVSGLRASDRGNNQEIRVTAVETDGDNRTDTWPSSLIFSITPPYALPVLPQAQAFVRQAHPRPTAIATFLPDRQRDANANAANQSNFRNVAQILLENNSIAVVSLDNEPLVVSGGLPTSGILVFPASSSSSSLLVGAVFTNGDSFPDFVLAALNQIGQRRVSPPTLQSLGTPVIASYASPTEAAYPSSALRYRQSPSLSPVEQQPGMAIPLAYDRRPQQAYAHGAGEQAGTPRIAQHFRYGVPSQQGQMEYAAQYTAEGYPANSEWGTAAEQDPRNDPQGHYRSAGGSSTSRNRHYG
ncbi:hypothetical protein CYLTODRAFT_443291 [Cylindrobasidium torrendii FP15055 ss-10]|uniref:Uncharacterized protein n=1 Tax=Cylindrobasidium torrendii FP15055 ss-10 TaxID=1314674 RepID=A0A0D7BD82_9AGAR|nr:hypothetical protein CYLTODRAFT_443291 [Cylindrobasidium torrendii FP15055 ss-10]